MGPGLEEMQVDGGKLSAGFDGWQQEDLAPVWPSPASEEEKERAKIQSCDSGWCLAGKKWGKSITCSGSCM